MSSVLKFAAAVFCAAGAVCFAGEGETATEEEKPAIELGGFVTVDYGTDLVNDADPSFGIGEVDLSANVNISREVMASITVMTYNRLDSLWIEQAMVAYTPSSLPLELLFGQQTLNHGLLTTRMISDPLLIDDVELVCPSVIVNGSFFDHFRGGLGFTVLSRFDESIREDIYLHTAVMNIDAQLPNESVVRLSSRANTDGTDIDIAGTINFWLAVLDFEGLYTASQENGPSPSGLYAGLSCEITDRLGCAIRADGLSQDSSAFKNMEMRIGGGVNVKIKDGIFCAIEFAQRRPFEGDPANEIALEVGLEQTIQLPGFQRKTLTRE